MIFNLSQGGESTITVTAPSGAVITAVSGNDTASGTVPPGSTSISLNVYVVAQWTVTCSYGGRTKSATVTITAYGETKSVQFSAISITSPTNYTVSVDGESRTNSGVLLVTGTGDKTVSCSYTSVPTKTTTVTVNAGTVSYSRQFSALNCSAPVGSTISCESASRTSDGVILVVGTGTKTVKCTYASTDTYWYPSVSSSATVYPSSGSHAFVYSSTLTVSTTSGATVTITKDSASKQLTATGGSCTFTLNAGELGTWHIVSSYNGYSASKDKACNAYLQSYSETVTITFPLFTFTRNGSTSTFYSSTNTTTTDAYYFYRSSSNWEFYIKQSGTINFPQSKNVDIFLCGGGNNGAAKLNNQSSGGNGGKRRTVTNINLSGQYTVTVGGAGADSSIGSYSSSSGTASTGGGQNNWTFSAGQDGDYSFGSSSMKGPDGNSRKVGAGGGHGGWSETDGSSGMSKDPTNGGTYGGGNGGTSHIDGSEWYANDGGNGSFYGAGGGGAGACMHTGSHSERNRLGNGGAGYQGFAAVRNKR